MARKPPADALRSPGIENRITIVGATGSGKSVAGLFHLSRAPFDEIPYTIIDSKEEQAFKDISLAVPLDLDANPPTKPGLYILRPMPGDDDDMKRLNAYFRKVHANGHHGLFIDEGYVVFPAKSRSPLISIFTQGRTRLTPVIMNTQRPTWIGREAISEASFFQVFDLVDNDDRKILRRFIPTTEAVNVMDEIGLYKSIYHDVSRRDGKQTTILKPVRPAEASIALIDARLEEMHREAQELREISTGQAPPVKLKLVRI